MIYMTLNQIREHKPCASGWEKLLKSLDRTLPNDEPVALSHIAAACGIADAIWCFRVNWFEHKSLYMNFVNWCALRAKNTAAAAGAAYATTRTAASADVDARAAYTDYIASAYAAEADASADIYISANAAAATATATAAATAERQEQTNYLLALLNAD